MNRSLLDLLKQGGYILYVRHGEAIVGEDQPNLNFWYCSTQRNLSELGRLQSIYYGQTLRNLQIPISYPILASPYCRTIETAQLAFGMGNTQINPYLSEINRLNENLSSEEKQRILDYIKSVFEIKPPQRSNRVIIAHTFKKDIGLGEIPNMGTVILKPLGPGNGYEVVDRLSLEDLGNYSIIREKNNASNIKI